MEGKLRYHFTACLWRHPSPAGWYFVSLPHHISKEIRENLKWQEEGWGRMLVIAQIGEMKWNTAIWFDTKMNTYLLPVKAEIRRKLKLIVDEELKVSIVL